MHRTQILLHDWQYEMLKARAESDGCSISSLVRDAVASLLGRAGGRETTLLGEIAGIGEDAASTGRGHDRVLYGPKARKRDRRR